MSLVVKKILITGARSFVGTSLARWLGQWPDNYTVSSVDLRGNEWRDKDFHSYDVIYHVAAIVHTKEKDANQYFRVNKNLAVEVAIKAKEEGVGQFIFLSTMGVYGKETGAIDGQTATNPRTPYAQSKLESEGLLNALCDASFKVVILRPPLVYGRNCKGNYPKLSGLALRLPLVPTIRNQRSMIFIDNLSEFVRLAIDRELDGLFFPQNKQYVETTELMQSIARVHSKRLRLVNGLTAFVSLGIILSATIGKVFGSLTYSKDMSGGPAEFEYETCSFEESVVLTESLT
jgi:UDP-glucose 4-epimerase